ncbi:MAG: putative DNA binding domain-containing protein [Chloracidobacterium sp.]|nr:putative DNA binding domain-containing protein [Chloracidobacterium sp.]
MASDEGERLEFKSAKSEWNQAKLNRYCVAICNEGGGKLILGVSDAKPREVVATNAFLDLNETKTKIFDKLRIRVDIDELWHAKGRVIVFHIPPRPKGSAMHYDGSYLMRVGEDLVPMSADQLRKIFDEGKPDFLSQIAVADQTPEDIVRLLDTQIYFDLLKIPYPSERGTVLERFEHEKLIRKREDSYDITNLGAILFAKDLEAFETLKGKAARVTVFEGINKFGVKSDGFGNRGYVVGFGNLIDYIDARLPSNEIIGKAFREDVKMFPPIAIRELVANALIHQDFQEQGIFVAVEIYANRMEISNPGLSPVAPDRLLDSYQSRNETLADLMRRLGICERQGSGIDKVIGNVEAWQLPAPDFRNSDKHFTAILFSHSPFSGMGKKDKIRACFQHCVLKYVMNEKMSNQSLRERFNLADSQADIISGIIKNTVDENLIKLEDPESTSKRYARYVPYWA